MFSHSNLLAWGSGLSITFSFSSITKWNENLRK
jgi:hypothetical protein